MLNWFLMLKRYIIFYENSQLTLLKEKPEMFLPNFKNYQEEVISFLNNDSQS